MRAEYKLDDVCGFFQQIEFLPSLHIPDDENNISFLHYAASNGAAEVLLRFLQHDSRSSSYLNSKSIYGWTPLYLACAGGHFLAAKYLLEHGADPNICDDSGRSCLHHLSRFALDKMLEI
ncbi:ankyrin repeat-containing domain protein, partial [Trichophaea hybrida]